MYSRNVYSLAVIPASGDAGLVGSKFGPYICCRQRCRAASPKPVISQFSDFAFACFFETGVFKNGVVVLSGFSCGRAVGRVHRQSFMAHSCCFTMRLRKSKLQNVCPPLWRPIFGGRFVDLQKLSHSVSASSRRNMGQRRKLGRRSSEQHMCGAHDFQRSASSDAGLPAGPAQVGASRRVWFLRLGRLWANPVLEGCCPLFVFYNQLAGFGILNSRVVTVADKFGGRPDRLN